MNMPMPALHTSYDLSLVVLSYLVAVLASYTALDLGGRVTAVRGLWGVFWLTAGAVAMGVGIWSMHFIAMLAFRMGMAVSYDLGTVILSVLFAVIGSGAGLAAASTGRLTAGRLTFGALFMGSGVVAMHYTGMVAMRMEATVTYDLGLFLLSVVIAVGASLAALWLTFRFRERDGGVHFGPKLLAGLVMGAAVSGMHYTGMAAAMFEPSSAAVIAGAISERPLALIVVMATVIYLGLTLLGVFVDRRMRQQAHQLLASEQQFQSLFAYNSDPVLALDLSGRVVDANPAVHQETGISLHTMRGRTLAELSILKNPEAIGQSFEHTLERGPQSFEAELILKEKDAYYAVTMVPIIVQGKTLGVYALGKNMTEQRVAADRIRYMAYHDDLTDLANRRLFLEELTKTLVAPRVRFLSLMMFDLDRFKAVNNIIGQHPGDQALTRFAHRLRDAAPSALVARIGSDEFAVLLTANSLSEARNRPEEMFRSLNRDFQWEGHELQLQASVGCAVYPTDGDNLDSLLKNADIALLWAKRHGRNQLRHFDKEMLLQAQLRVEIEQGLRRALERDEFEVMYQVQKSMDGVTTGTEALLRWNPPHRKPIPPSEFIPVAEDSGLIKAIGTWVLRTACHQNKAWQDAGLPPIVMSVNLSIKQFEQPDFVGIVAGVLHETGLDPRFLDLEITESMAMEAEQTLRTLNGLKGLGVGISMDDFGTGYSSLSSLKRFPIDNLKIDQSFVRDIVEGKEAPIVETVIAVAHTFKLNVIAEGVETDAQMQFLKNHGCDVVQGYFFGKPQTSEEFRAAHLA
jgi:diguanylate cyclase (GGDEF)-like protein/PAS domain S-box-containing protein